MKLISKIALCALTVVSLATSTLQTRAAHESNNFVVLRDANGDVGGAAVVNYIAGKSKQAGEDIFNASALAYGLPEGMYIFAVRFNAGGDVRGIQPVCMLVSDGVESEAYCSDSQFPLGGFHEGLILDMDGNIVLSGFFERRGGNRAKE